MNKPNLRSQRISQIDLVLDISTILNEKHGVETVLSRQLNAIIQAADTIIAALAVGEITCADGAGMTAWAASDQTGASSLYMAWIFGVGPSHDYAFPHDASDFGRCLGLLRACPELRGKLHLMRTTGTEWAKIFAQWGTLCVLHAGGQYVELSTKLSAIGKNT